MAESAGETIRQLYLNKNRKLKKLVSDHLVNLKIAQQIYDQRTKAGLTQTQLAALINTTPSVICRLEDANYNGHSLSMLKKIASALGKELHVNFVDSSRPALPRATG
jgi:ribosome-binding protein aMBF1 (putative translation factor)